MTAPEESDTVPSSLPVAAADCACPKGDDSDKARANKKAMHKKRVETDDCAMHFFMIWAPVWPNYTQLKRYCLDHVRSLLKPGLKRCLPVIYEQVKCARYRSWSWMRTLLGGGWRFSKLGPVHENMLRLRVVCHGLRAQFRFHFASFAVVFRRVLAEDVDPPFTRRHEHEAACWVVHIRVGSGADGE